MQAAPASIPDVLVILEGPQLGCLAIVNVILRPQLSSHKVTKSRSFKIVHRITPSLYWPVVLDVASFLERRYDDVL